MLPSLSRKIFYVSLGLAVGGSSWSGTSDSLVVSPSGVVAMNLLYHIAPDRYIGRLAGANNVEAMGLFSSNLSAALAWGGEVIKHLTRAQREAGDLHRNFEDTAEHCTKLENGWWRWRLLGPRRRGLPRRTWRLEVEKAALMSVKKALEVDKAALRAELDETKARAAEEAEHLRSEAVNAWDLGKDAFLNSSEFSALCAKKASGYFKVGFSGCLAQFRAIGYSN
ncbi:respiratory burst oxidaseprotein A-like [Dorcoceras hygrometricum]|uniref:Respiratory burst oxidaseprotein A-like n=1 Tax=Dorcoceras hygrometricum TaxID=472368 RepID=A0A2Z7BXV1_9LAMI|nr:respiratory burst oxidaseprotein A-like [Dorcoceras hygrometricum]